MIKVPIYILQDAVGLPETVDLAGKPELHGKTSRISGLIEIAGRGGIDPAFPEDQLFFILKANGRRGIAPDQAVDKGFADQFFFADLAGMETSGKCNGEEYLFQMKGLPDLRVESGYGLNSW
jgi:hypothetical protein